VEFLDTSTGGHVAIRITAPSATTTKVQFVLPDDIHHGPVSAVGTFNEWTPGTHKLVRRTNGTRSVTITLDRGQDVRFRYLGADGHWFDDPDAHEIDASGSVLHL
jgi:hypothetical protein